MDLLDEQEGTLVAADDAAVAARCKEGEQEERAKTEEGKGVLLRGGGARISYVLAMLSEVFAAAPGVLGAVACVAVFCVEWVRWVCWVWWVCWYTVCPEERRHNYTFTITRGC